MFSKHRLQVILQWDPVYTVRMGVIVQYKGIAGPAPWGAFWGRAPPNYCLFSPKHKGGSSKWGLCPQNAACAPKA